MPGTSPPVRRSSTARSWSLARTPPPTSPSCRTNLKGKSKKIVLVALDLLYLNGYDLRRLPLIERKAHLKKIIDGTDIQLSESFEVDGM